MVGKEKRSVIRPPRPSPQPPPTPPPLPPSVVFGEADRFKPRGNMLRGGKGNTSVKQVALASREGYQRVLSLVRAKELNQRNFTG